MIQMLRWLVMLALTASAGRLVPEIKLPSIGGWLIIGMIFGPYALGLTSKSILGAVWYRTVIMWMQCAFGLMLVQSLREKNSRVTVQD